MSARWRACQKVVMKVVIVLPLVKRNLRVAAVYWAESELAPGAVQLYSLAIVVLGLLQ